jgi:hypothetical protein
MRSHPIISRQKGPIMGTRNTVVLCGILVGVAACDLGTLTTVPRDGRIEVAGGPLRWTVMCADSVAAVHLPVAPDPAVIAINCSVEAGCQNDPSPHGYDWEIDRMYKDGILNFTHHDWVFMRCSNGDETGIGSDDACWDCVGGCAGSACPGQYCTAIPNRAGSDCLAFTCPAGYGIERGPGDYHTAPLPYCRFQGLAAVCYADDPRAPMFMVDGPERVRPGAQCTWTAAVSGAPQGYTITWYNDGRWQGTGDSYTGGLQDGSVSTHFRIRADVSAPGYSGSSEILVRVDSRAPFCPS